MIYYYYFDDGIECIVANNIHEAEEKAKKYKEDAKSSSCVLMDVL